MAQAIYATPIPCAILARVSSMFPVVAPTLRGRRASNASGLLAGTYIIPISGGAMRSCHPCFWLASLGLGGCFANLLHAESIEGGGNSGPANVDIKLWKHWPEDDELRCSQEHGLRHAIEIIRDVVWGDCVVADGWGRSQEIAQRACHLLNRRFVCITHGWLPYENEVNGLGFSEDQMRKCASFMGRCNAIAAVSRLQAEFDAVQLPGMEARISWFFNGVEGREPIQHQRIGHLVVSVSGGTRPIKRNDIVADACELLREKGIGLELRVYGRDYAGDTSWLARPGVRYMGQVAQDEFLAGLAETDVFVMASLHESFGLSAIDALQAGASLLLSDTCGVADTLALQDGDVVSHEASPELIADRIMALYKYPNAGRLAASIDYGHYSWDAAAKRLRAICAGEGGYPLVSEKGKD